MADAVQGGLNVLEAGLAGVLAVCHSRLSPLQFQLVQQQRDVLLQKGLVDPDVIRSFSLEQLVAIGLSPGAAAALKMVYPSPAGANVDAQLLANMKAVLLEMWRPFRLAAAMLKGCKPLREDVSWGGEDPLMSKRHPHVD